MFPIVAATGMKPSTSWPATKFVIVTVAMASVVLFASVTVILGLIGVAGAFSMYEVGGDWYWFRTKILVALAVKRVVGLLPSSPVRRMRPPVAVPDEFVLLPATYRYP